MLRQRFDFMVIYNSFVSSYIDLVKSMGKLIESGGDIQKFVSTGRHTKVCLHRETYKSMSPPGDIQKYVSTGRHTKECLHRETYKSMSPPGDIQKYVSTGDLTTDVSYH
jgi:hypothetical protein